MQRHAVRGDTLAVCALGAVICCLMVGGSHGLSSFGSNLVVNGEASSNNFNGWTQTQSDHCQFSTQNSVRMFTGPNDANIFNIKSCTIAQTIAIGFASKYVLTRRATMSISGYFGATGNDYSTFTVQQRNAAGTTVETTTIGDVKGTFATRTATDIELHRDARTLYVAFKAQQGGLGLRCDAWGTSLSVILTRRTWTTSYTITPPPTPTHTGIQASSSQSQTDAASHTVHTRSYSATHDHTWSNTHSLLSPTQTASNTSSMSTSLSLTNSTTPTGTATATRRSWTVSPTHSRTATWTVGHPTRSATSTLSAPTPSRSWSNGHPTESATHTMSAPSPTRSNPESQTQSSSDSMSLSERTVTTSCGNAPPITIRIDGRSSSDSASAICHASGITRVTMSAPDLLYHTSVVMAVEYANELSAAWVVVGAVTGPGVAEGATANVSKQGNASASVDGASMWRVRVVAGRGGWQLISLSPYVSQRWTIVLTLGCAGMGETASYSIIVDAVGAPLPFSTVTVVTSTFAQAVTQVASGTLVPASLSTMRALARLASCGTSDSGVDSSTGVVSVVAKLVERFPIKFAPDALDVLSNLGLCVLVGAFLLIAATVVNCMLCGEVTFLELASRVHLPSILCPVAMFALPTALGSSVAIVSQQVNDDGGSGEASNGSSASLAVGVAGVSLSGLFFIWLVVVGFIYGPCRVRTCPSKPGLRQRDAARSPNRAMAWCVGIAAFAMHRNVSWRPLDGASPEEHQRNARWKYAHHILMQDVRFQWVPVAEAACALVATISTAMVTVPGFGCQAAVVTIAVVYVVQAVSFAALRPYTSPLTHYFSLACNVLTVLATGALAVDIFEVEHQYSMRFSVAFQLLLMGFSSVKGFVDIVEFVEGLRRIIRWIFLAHDQRMGRLQDGFIVVHHFLDDVDDESVAGALPLNPDVGLRSLPSIELYAFSPTPLEVVTPKLDRHSQHCGSQLPQLPSNESMVSTAPEMVVVDARPATPTSPSSPASHPPGSANHSFSLQFGVDEEEVHRRWWDRHRRQGKQGSQPTSATTAPKRNGFTMFMVDEAAITFADGGVEPTTPRAALEVDAL